MDASGTGMECTAGEVCVGVLPTGWAGPVYLGSREAGSEDLACPSGEAPEQTSAVFVGLAESEGECACSCPSIGEIACAFDLEYFLGTSCMGDSVGMDTVASGACIAPAAVTPPQSVRTTDVSVGQCSPGSVRGALEIPTWSEELTVCSVQGGPGLCDGDCAGVPGPEFGSRICIRQEGDHECVGTAPFVDSRVVAYESFRDDRTCPLECGCESNDSVACPGQSRVGGTAGCQTDFFGLDIEQCNPRAQGIDYVSVEVEDMQGEVTCAPIEAVLEVAGAVEPLGPVTYCCQDVG